MVRPDDGPIGLKHVVLNVLLMVIIDVLDENINILYKINVLVDSLNPLVTCTTNKEKLKIKLAKMKQFL
jgi:hypothetical protein